MSDAPTATPAPAAVPNRNFRTARPRYDPLRATRQGRIVRLAVERLGVPAAMQFLNSFDATLGRKPMDVAGEGEEGAAQVERVLDTLGTQMPAPPPLPVAQPDPRG